jgi:CheY-like chemotaxis protein
MDERFGLPIRVLLVEDNPGDVRLTMEALGDAKVKNQLTVASDGIEALALLRGATLGERAGPFDLVVLDLNLPKKNGREVLAELKSDPRVKHIPVVILTTSKTERDITETYALHANCYVTKPLDFEQFMQVVQSIEHFWLSVVTLPGGKAHDYQLGANSAY